MRTQASSVKPRLALPLLAAAAIGLLAPNAAEAKPKRRGLQKEFMIGASTCISGRAECSAENDAIAGRTNPHVGVGVTLGYRPLRFLMFGAAFNLGFFNPEYEAAGADVYRHARQHSYFGIMRLILPIWRFDIGLEVGPGWSRQIFRGTEKLPFSRVFSQGFAMKTGPVIDIFVTRRLFLGIRADIIINRHNRVCTDDLEWQRSCASAQDTDQAAVHQVTTGFHIGSVF